MDEIDLHERESVVSALEEKLERKLDVMVTAMAVSLHKNEAVDEALQQKLTDTYLQYKAVSQIRRRISENFQASLAKISRQNAEKWSTKEKIMAGLYIILILSILALFINTYRFY